ncbi:discoidin domain-containing protein [Paenibacillus assamensis]|uniref:discoidin domain-containing protein n=1 Tax=Paenibacillus assamensis TaxID=311244 RepID=UPI000419296D|nr:discoidin domain-containing protein [Paenibacillus assamensis]
MNVNHLHYYRYRHINCFIAQYLSELLDKGIPVDYLFYDSYIDTDVIMNEIIVNGETRWAMQARTLKDISIIGIHILHRYFPNLLSAYPYMKNKFEENKIVYLWVSQSFIPHLAHLPSGIHSIGIQGYEETEKSFIISDVPGLVGHSYDERHIQDAFDKLEEEYKFIYYLYDKEYSFPEETIQLLISDFEYNFMNINEDLTLYDRVIELLSNPPLNRDEQEILYTHLENVFAVVAGSRYFLSKFFKITRYSDIDQLIEISKLSENIQNILRKAIVGGNITKYNVEEKIMKLKSLEQENIKTIKELIIHKREQYENNNETQNKSQSMAVDIGLKYKSIDLNRGKLEWVDVIQDEYLYGYEIFIDDKWCGSTLLNSYELVNLNYDTSYHIRVRVKNFSGYIEQYNDSVTIHTGNKRMNIALGKPVYCSSEETSIFTKENVNNGIDGTRWGSVVGSDQEWICIDLLETARIQRVVLNWESHAKCYTIDVSDDNVTWETIIVNNHGVGGVEEFNNLQNIDCRYIRMNGLMRGTTWGYSLWDFEVYAV